MQDTATLYVAPPNTVAPGERAVYLPIVDHAMRPLCVALDVAKDSTRACPFGMLAGAVTRSADGSVYLASVTGERVPVSVVAPLAEDSICGDALGATVCMARQPSA